MIRITSALFLLAMVFAALVWWSASTEPLSTALMPAASPSAALVPADVSLGGIPDLGRVILPKRTAVAASAERGLGAEAVPARGELAVRVVSRLDQPLAGVRLLANGEPIGSTDRDGWLIVACEPGVKTVGVDPATLPQGFLAPPLQDRQRPSHGVPAGFYSTAASVAVGQRVTVVVSLFRAAQVSGVVVDPVGQPIAGCSVRLQSLEPGLAGLCMDMATDAVGLYQFLAVPPGRYVVAVVSSHATPRAAVPNPLPAVIEVVDGAAHALPPMIGGDRRAELSGRIVDQDGAPVSGVPVVVYPASKPDTAGVRGFGLAESLAEAETAKDGTFQLAAPSGSLFVQAHPMGMLLDPADPRRLRRLIAPLRVEAGVGQVPLGDLRAELCRPFVLKGLLRCDLAKLVPSQPGRRPRSPEVFVAAAADLADESRWVTLKLQRGAAAGTYQWSHCCDTPAPPQLLIVRSRGLPPLIRPFEPQPGEQQLTVDYP